MCFSKTRQPSFSSPYPDPVHSVYVACPLSPPFPPEAGRSPTAPLSRTVRLAVRPPLFQARPHRIVSVFCYQALIKSKAPRLAIHPLPPPMHITPAPSSPDSNALVFSHFAKVPRACPASTPLKRTLAAFFNQRPPASTAPNTLASPHKSRLLPRSSAVFIAPGDPEPCST